MDNVNSAIVTANQLDDEQNPTGGYVMLVVEKDGISHNALTINWQDGPRGQEDGTLAAPNGAFVEDVIFAAKQRLEFFQDSKYVSTDNKAAIESLNDALKALSNRSKERAEAGTLGKHEV